MNESRNRWGRNPRIWVRLPYVGGGVSMGAPLWVVVILMIVGLIVRLSH